MTLLSELQSKKANADYVLESLGLKGTHPINPFEVIEKLGIHQKFLTEDVMTKVFGKLGLIDGFSFKDKGEYYIAVGSTWSKNAQKFTAAQELGHIILHKDLIPIHKNFNPKSLRSEATTFAVNLLMPLDLIKKYGHLPLSVLTEIFDVSPRVIQLRVSSVY